MNNSCLNDSGPNNSDLAGFVVALDFETSDNGPDAACALGMARIWGGAIEDTFYTLIRPPRNRVYYTHIHGLTWNMLRTAPTFAQIWPQIDGFIAGADYLVAHNAAFDSAVLRGCCLANGINPPDQPFLCTVRGARKGLNLPHNRLNNVCDHLGITLQHHNAESDAIAAARIFLHLREKGLPLADMMPKQKKSKLKFLPGA